MEIINNKTVLEQLREKLFDSIDISTVSKIAINKMIDELKTTEYKVVDKKDYSFNQMFDMLMEKFNSLDISSNIYMRRNFIIVVNKALDVTHDIEFYEEDNTIHFIVDSLKISIDKYDNIMCDGEKVSDISEIFITA